MKYFYQLRALRDKAADGRTTVKSLAKYTKEYVSLFDTQADLAKELTEYVDTYYEWCMSYSLMMHITFAALSLPYAEHSISHVAGIYGNTIRDLTFQTLAEAFKGTDKVRPNACSKVLEIESYYKGDK